MYMVGSRYTRSAFCGDLLKHHSVPGMRQSLQLQGSSRCSSKGQRRGLNTTMMESKGVDVGSPRFLLLELGEACRVSLRLAHDGAFVRVHYPASQACERGRWRSDLGLESSP